LPLELVFANKPTRGRVGQADLAVGVGPGQDLAIRREGQAADGVERPAVELEALLARGHVPDPDHGFFQAERGKRFARWRKGDAENASRLVRVPLAAAMADDAAHELPRGPVPKAEDVVLPSRSHGATVGREREGEELEVAAADAEENLAGRPVPDADGAVVGGRNQFLAVR